MKYVISAIQGLFSLYGFALFIIVMLLLFPFVFIASWFGRIKGGNMIYRICQLWADIMMFCWGIRHTNLYEAPHDPGKPYVFVFNHVSYMDVPTILKTIRHQHFRVLGKAEMAKVPVFGFFYKNSVVMVERSNIEKRAASVKVLQRIITKGISVVIAPEGTFNTSAKPLKDFYDGAFKIAIETQTPIRPLLFLDTFDRLHHQSVFTLSPGRSRAVYLEEIKVDGLSNKDVPMLKEKVYRLMEQKLIDYRASWIDLPRTMDAEFK